MKMTKDDWYVRPMEEPAVEAALDGMCFKEAELARIQDGLRPSEMEDKWFLYFEDGWLMCVQGMSGKCVYRVHFSKTEDGYAADSYIKQQGGGMEGMDELILGALLYYLAGNQERLRQYLKLFEARVEKRGKEEAALLLYVVFGRQILEGVQ